MSLCHLPNALSAVRIMLVPPAIAALVAGRYRIALLVLLLAGLTDGLDGYLARRYGWTSRLGSILDPVADKLLVVGAYVALGWLGYMPVWLVILVVGRDVVIVTGVAAYHFTVGVVAMAPTPLSKVNSGLQVVYAVLVVAALARLPVPAIALDALAWVVAASTVGSGLNYVWIWGQKAAAYRGGKA
jgi:cardiolipin synthase